MVEGVVVVTLDRGEAEHGRRILEDVVEHGVDDALQRLDLEDLAELGLALDLAHGRDAGVVRVLRGLLDPLATLLVPGLERRRLVDLDRRDAAPVEEVPRAVDVGDRRGGQQRDEALGLGAAHVRHEGDRGDAVGQHLFDELAEGHALLGEHLVLDEQGVLVDVDRDLVEAHRRQRVDARHEVRYRLHDERVRRRVEPGVGV